jgi:tRNA A-37 threonylcarbamoyl transferase component Bud32
MESPNTPGYLRVKELFSSAVELPREEWESFIVSQTPGQVELRSQILELLEFHSQETLHREPPKKAFAQLEDSVATNPWHSAWANLFRSRLRRLTAVFVLLLTICGLGLFYSQHLKQALVEQWSLGIRGTLGSTAAQLEHWGEHASAEATWAASDPSWNEMILTGDFSRAQDSLRPGMRWRVVSREGKTLAENWPTSSTEALIPFRVPIRQNDQVVADLIVGRRANLEFQTLLSNRYQPASTTFYGVTKDGLVITGSRMVKDSRTVALPPVVEAFQQLDKGSGPRSQTALSGAVTKPYRNLSGQESVGAWVWIENLGMAAVAEVPWAEVMRLSAVVDQAVAALGLTAIGLGVWSLISSFLLARVGRDRKHKRLGDYQIERLLSRGGMGEIYLARHRTLRRSVAIKLMREDRVNRQYRGFFEREATLAARLRHPNTISVFDFGCTDDGTLYYVMEYVDGLTLYDLVRTHGPQETSRVCHLLEQVSSSLEEAHSLGLVHRDIKPSNIMVTRIGPVADHVKVLDFGLAGFLDRSQEDGRMVLGGTLHYVAPEATTGEIGFDERADVYSLGALGYFLLFGQKPHISELNEYRREGAHLSPGRFALLQILLQCMEVDPENRPAGMAEVRMRLAQLEISEDWRGSRASLWWDRQHAPMASGSEFQDLERLAEKLNDVPGSDDSSRALVAQDRNRSGI